MSFVIPDGATISEVKGRVQAVGVALLFTYAVGCASLSSILLVCVLLELADLMRPLFSF